MPWFWWLASAQTRQWRLTGQLAQIAFAWLVWSSAGPVVPSGKKTRRRGPGKRLSHASAWSSDAPRDGPGRARLNQWERPVR